MSGRREFVAPAGAAWRTWGRGPERGVRAEDLAREARLPEAIQLEVAGRWPAHLITNRCLSAAGWLAVACGPQPRYWLPGGQSVRVSVGLAVRALEEMERPLRPETVAWVVQQVMDARGCEACAALWPLVVDAAHGWARYGPVVPTVTSCLVRRAPVGVRGELGELGTVPDRLAALALDARDRQLVGSGESWASYLLGAVGGTDRWRALCAGQLQFEELGTLAALCRVRPELGQALGEELARAVTGPWDGEVRYRARAVAALAWTIPWSLPGGGRSRELGEGLEALAELADDRARAELGALTVLAGMGTVPGSIQAAARRVGDAYGVRPWRRGRDLRCYCRLAGAGGGRYARWLLVGRGRRRGPVAELLRVRPCTGWVGRDHGWSDVRAVERACGADTGAWRLALSLADGQLTGEELAATVSVALR